MTEWEEVRDAAEVFRRQHAKLAEKLPVDVFYVAELDLRLNLIPFPDSMTKFAFDAAITPDFESIYIDQESYVLLERGPAWKYNRLRFSVAHELGHFVLHKAIALKLGFKSFEEFKEWTKTYRGMKHTVEQGANEFAGRLLVPVEALIKFYDAFVEHSGPDWEPSPVLRAKFSNRAASKFGVNADVIGVRLDREGIWPAE
jgi:Zn-dependent peptidase ImmA (M78 family)